MPEIETTAWTPEHFIGGHPAIDFTNTVYDRLAPPPDNELLRSARDVGNWLGARGLTTPHRLALTAGIGSAGFMEQVRALREASFSVFDSMAGGDEPPAGALAPLFEMTAVGLSAGHVEMAGTRPVLRAERFGDADAVAAFLAALAVEGYYTLPRDRLHSCPRCGWLFVDQSRGGKRRWCSMKTCGNREKASRHRSHGAASG